MDNELNKPLPNEVEGLNNNLENLNTLEPKVQEYSSLEKSVNNTDPTDPTDPKKSKKVTKDKPILGFESTNTKSHPLQDIGKFTNEQIQAGIRTPINIDLDEYSKYFGKDVGFFTDVKQLNKERAYEQSTVEQFKNATGRVIANVIPEVISQLSNVVDLEDYFNSDEEVGNWLSTEMEKLKQNTNEALPIYRENPDTPLDYTDNAWWFENGSSLVTSALGFVGTGYITGGTTSSIIGKGGQWAKNLAKLGGLTNKEQQIARGLSTVTTAVALNQAEGIGIGVETFNESYNNEVKRIKEDSKNINLSEDDIDKLAREKASKDATSAINFNKVNILLNLVSADLFLKTPSSTRNLISKPNFKKNLGLIGLEGTQEYTEEVINDISKQQALNKDYGFKEALNHVLSIEGVESGLLGFIGGAGQTALIKAGKVLPIYKNRNYNNAYADAYSTLDNTLSEEEKVVEANKLALEKVGISNKYISQKNLDSIKYAKQQDALNRYDEMSSTEKVSDMTNVFYSTEENTELLKQITKAKENNNNILALDLQNKLFNLQAFNAFELGTTESLLDLYEGYKNLTEEDAENKGLPIENDEYKSIADKAIEDIKSLENIYINSSRFINSSEIYFAEEKKYSTNKEIVNTKEKITNLFNLAEEQYKEDLEKNPSKNKTYLDLESELGYDINKVTPGFKSTPIYKEIKSLVNSYESLKENIKNIQDTLDIITTKEYQTKLNKIINTNRNRDKKELLESVNKEIKQKAKESTNELVTNIEKSVIEETTDILPIIEDEEEVDIVAEEENKTEKNNTKQTSSSTEFRLDIPTLNIPELNTSLAKIKDTVENSNNTLESRRDYVQHFINTFGNNISFLENTSPFDVPKVKDFIENLKKVKEDLELDITNINHKENKVKLLQQDFIEDLLTDLEEESNIEKDNSPNTKANYTKTLQRVNTLINILENLEEIGVDTSNFKDIVLSFESATGKEEVITIFNILKGLYNAATNSNIEGTYETIMYSNEEKRNIIDTYKSINEYNKASDIYSNIHDNISKDVLAVFFDLAELNNLKVSDSGLSFEKYNITASNKLAYLAKQYNYNFEPKVSSTGKPYIEVSKQDITNLLNTVLDQRVLDSDFLSVGKEIEFVPLKSITLEDGTILTQEESTVDNSPIGIKIEGELIDGLFLHDVTWLASNNLNNTKEGIIEDQNKLRNLRKLILNNGSVKTKIINRSPGVPILDSTGQLNSVLTNMPDVEIGISKEGQIYKNENEVEEIINKTNIKEGKGVILIPYENKKLALVVKRTKLQRKQKESIIKAVSYYLDGKSNEITNKLDKNFGYNILSAKGLESYLSNFIQLSKLPFKDYKGFLGELNNIPDNINIIQFTNSSIYYGNGQGIDKNYIKKDKNEGEERLKDIKHFSTYLDNVYSNINLSKLTSNENIPFISENDVYTPYKDYVEYSKDQMLTPYLGIKLDNGKTIYTVQSRIHFDLDGIFQQTIKNKEKESSSESGNNIENKTSITLATGKSFSFDDITEDYNPNLDSGIEYNLKAVNILSSNKAIEVFSKGEKNNWSLDKILTELQIPKEQKQLILDLNIKYREQIILELLLNYNYNIEIYTSKEVKNIYGIYNELENYYNNLEYYKNIIDSGKNLDSIQLEHYNRIINEPIPKPFAIINENTGESIESFNTEKEAEKRLKELKVEINNLGKDTDFYKKLTVPGGTNYKENEITIPAIIPNIKGHAEFATDNGIGWFRSDDLQVKNTDKRAGDLVNIENFNIPYYIDSKTRRILEVQSDLFQKGRNKKNLDIQNDFKNDKYEVFYNKLISSWEIKINNDLGLAISKEGRTLRFNNEKEANNYIELELSKKDTKENQFLQLLNKNNNWVTFFVKSIIQDSTKKGYEKVLFPVGDTVAKIEGHSTLEEFKKQKEARIKELEYKINTEKEDLVVIKDEYGEAIDNQLKVGEDLINHYKKEIKQLKQEIIDVESGQTQLSSIVNFYETTVTNILNKTYGKDNIEVITDEYGNTWNEINLDKNKYYNIDLNPNINKTEEDIINDLVETSTLIKGISLQNQTALTKSIANNIYTNLVNNIGEADYNVLLKPEVELHIQALEQILDLAIELRPDRVPVLEKQISAIRKDIKKIYNGVKVELGKLVNLNSLELYNSDQEVEVLDEESINERSIFLDTLQYTIDPRTTLTEKVKNFFTNIIDKKALVVEGETYYKNKVTSLGLNVYIPFDIVFNDLLSILSQSNNNAKHLLVSSKLNKKYGEQKDYVVQALELIEENISKKPYLLDVVTKLKDAPIDLQNAVILALNKAHTNHIFLQSTYNSNKKLYSIRPNKAARRNVENLVLSEWQNNIRNSNFIEVLDNTTIVNREKLSKFNTLYQELLKTDVVYTENNINAWLNIIGINLPKELIEFLNKNGLYQNNKNLNLPSLFVLSNGIFKNIYTRVNKFNPDLESFLTLEDFGLFDDNAFKILAKLVSDYKDNLTTNSFKNGNGDTVYGYTTNRYAISRALQLKTDENLLTDLLEDPFTKYSSWLKDFTYNTSEGVKINKNSLFYKYFEYGTSDSLKVKENKIGKTIDTLNSEELSKYHLGLFYNRGLSVGSTDKTPIMRVVYPTMSDKANTFIFQVPGKFYSLDNEGKLGNNHIEDLVKTIIYPELERILSYQNNKDRVNIKEYNQGAGKFLILPIMNEVEELWDNGELKEDVLTSATYLPIYNKIIRNYLNYEVKNVIEEWTKANIIKEVVDKNGKVKSKVLNYVDDNYNKTFKPKNYVELAVNYVINTNIANMNFQQLFIGDPALYYKGKKTAFESAIATADNMGKRLAVDNAGKADFLSEKNENFNVLVVNDNLMTSSIYPYITNTFGEEFAKNYIDINSTDAQEYTTLKEHLLLNLKEGKLTESTYNEVLDYYNLTGKIKKDLEDKVKKIILSPYKPVYGNNYQRDGINSRLYIKSSSFPLIAEFTKGLEIDKLRQFIEDNNIDRIAHESAVKVGQPKELTNIYKEGKIDIPVDWKKGLLTNVPRQGHGNQQEVPYSAEKQEVNDGTQQSKLLFTNILDVKDFINPITKEKNTGRELADLYHETYKSIFKNNYEDLIKSLQVVNGSVTNVKKLKRLLVDEGLSRNYSLNDLAALELDEVVEKFSVPLWLNNSDTKINALLNSIVDNRIRKRKFKGKSFVLGAPSAIRTLNTTDKTAIVKVRDWDGELKASFNKEGIMTYSEVLLPFKFWDNNGKLLNIKDFIKEDNTLDLDRIPEEALEIFGYRIPTSGINLISTIKVVGFLPDSYGDLVIAPLEFIVQMGSDFDVDKLYTHMYNTIYLEEENKIEILRESNKDLLKNKIKELSINNNILQNILLDIHKSVLNNPDKEVQYARNRALSFGKLPEIAKVLDSNKNNKYFSVLSNSYQRYKYSSARAGKTAVGIFSLDMVLNTSLQYVEEDLYFLEESENNLNEKSYLISGISSTKLNTAKTKSGRYKSEVIEAYMTAALDNEKEQLLGKLDIDGATFDFIRIMNQLGYEEDLTINIIKQPLIQKNLEIIRKTNKLPILKNKEEYQSLIAETSISDLKDNIKTVVLDDLTQEAFLYLFVDLSNKGKQLKLVQSAINSDSSGIGKNLFYTMEKVNQIISLPEKTKIKGIEKIIGDYYYLSDVGTVEEVKDIVNKGYKYNNLVINPNSINGFASVYATLTNSTIWNNFLPYSTPSFSYIIDNILNSKLDKSESLTNKAKAKENIVSSYKSYLTNSSLNLFTNKDIYTERKELLFDTEESMSLGSIIQDLKNKNIYTNTLLDRLQIGRTNTLIDITGKIPTDINYVNALTLDMDEDLLVNSFIDMLSSNKELGEYNGKILTTKILADKLIIHQIITGGVQKSGQFIKYIPFNYLKNKGYYNTLEINHETGIVENNLKQYAENFKTQYIQHNPEEFYFPEVEKFIEKTNIGELVVKDKEIKLPNILVIENGNKFEIYKYKKENDKYIQIDNLGYKGILEYDINSNFSAKSNIYINTSNYKTSETENIPSSTDVANFLSIDRDTTQDNSPLLYNTKISNLATKYYLKDNNLPIADRYRMILLEISENNTNPIIKHFSKKILPIVDYLSETPLYLDNKLKAKGSTYTSKIFGEPLQTRINPTLINSEKELQEVLLEEIIHAVLKRDLNNNSTSSINTLFNEVKLVAKKKYGEEIFNIVENKINNGLPLKEGVESKIIYNLRNIDEFVAASIKDETFQRFLSESETVNTTKSLWQKFISSIRNILEKLGVKKDSNLEAVLHEIYNKFDKRNFELYDSLTVPTYVRSIEYLNNRFNLLDADSTPLIKGNSKEIANFIDKHIVNVKANIVNNTVVLESNYSAFIQDNSPNIELEVNTEINGNFSGYISNINIRLKRLNNNIKKAKVNKDLTKVANLEELLEQEQEKLLNIKEVSSLVELSIKAKEDLQVVDTILNRSMSEEDMVYARGIVNFWKNAKQEIFNSKTYSSDALVELFGGIEGLAEKQSMKLFQIEKDYIESIVKKYTNKDVNLDSVFDDYKDINFLQGNVRDISTYDNELLNTIWLSVKQANIDATTEGEILLEGFSTELESIIPILKNINNKDVFEIFRQKTTKGKYTNHLINRYNNSYYKDRYKYLSKIYSDNNYKNILEYSNWLSNNTISINLKEIFPIEESVDKDIKNNRLALKLKLGEGGYNYWFNKQEKLIKHYEDKKEGYLDKLLNDNNLKSLEELENNKELMQSYNYWIAKNSPYVLSEATYGKGKLLNTKYYGSHNYLEVIPKKEEYLDSNFKIIENNQKLLSFYNRVDNILEELKQYVPEEQQKTLAYGGIPEIEKSLYELYREKGMSLGFTPIYNTFIKSMQTSYSSSSVSEIDPNTGKPYKELRIPLIKNNSKEIQSYIEKQIIKYKLENNINPSAEQIAEFREDIIDKLSRENTFDLGKIVKVYSALVLAHKHKHQIEDMVKVANTILESYQETQLRPDGRPIVNISTGVIQKKEKASSFVKTKEALDSYIKNIFYNDIKEEEGKGKTILTKDEKVEKTTIDNQLLDLENKYNNNEIEFEDYKELKSKLEKYKKELGKTFIYSKAGDNVLKYIQLKLMGWNVLGGVSNMGFGYLANYIEASGGQLFNTKELNYAYKLVSNSILKNATFNKVESDIAKKIRNAMNKWDVLKEASNELYSSSTSSSLTTKSKWLSPYNMNQRTEYLNQAPLLIALSRNTKIETDKGEINIWEGYDSNWNWKKEYGEEPKEVISKLRIKLDQIIKRTHGNYDNLSPLAGKRVFLGRAMSQFRTWLFESIAVRVEKERYDDALGIYVKGRYRSVGTVYSNSNIGGLALETLKSLLKNYTFGLVDKSKDFDKFIDGENIKEVDAANMRRVVKEINFAMNMYLFLLLLSSLKGDDDDSKISNILFNQGTRLKTDLLLYVNPIEARNLIRDIVPAMAVVKDTTDWFESVGKLIGGKDEVESGVHSGDSRLGASSLKMLPFGAKAYSLYNSASQVYDK